MAGVNVNMGVTGIAQFKQNINTAKTSLKTLDEQLKLTEKQYKASGDAEEYMQQKSEQLKSKLEVQKSIVEETEKALQSMMDNGVDKSSKAFQDMVQQLARAKGDMLDTRQEMDALANGADEAANNTDSMNQQLKRIGDGVSFQNVTDGLGKITEGLKKTAQKAVQLGQKMAQAMLGAGAWADDLSQRSQVYGISVEELQRMDKTAAIIDTDVDAILKAKKKLRTGLGKESKETMGAFAALGIDPNDTKGEDLFWKIGERILALKDENKQEVYSTQLLGKSWQDLLPLFKAGRKEYEEMNASWSVVSEDTINSLGEMDDEYQKLKNNFETLKMELLGNFAEPMEEGMKGLNEVIGKFQEYLNSEEGKQMVENVVGVVSDTFKWIVEHPDDVVNALKAIVIGWGGIKLIGGALQVMKFVNGLTGLTAKTGADAAAAGATAGTSWAGAFASAAMKAAPFLAFLYTLLNPSGGSDEIGNNDLLDKDGKLTKEAEAYGYKLDANGDLVMPEAVPEQFTKTPEHTTIDLSKPGKLLKGVGDWTLPDDASAEEAMAFVRAQEEAARATERMEEAVTELNGSTEAQNKGNSEMTEATKSLKDMPAELRRQLERTQIRAYILGSDLAPFVNSSLGRELQAEE